MKLPPLLFRVIALSMCFVSTSACAENDSIVPVPEFTSDLRLDWINSPPLTKRQLLGSVVLMDVWTYDCWNCYRSFPWLNDLEKRFETRGFRIVGIHTPEFEHERLRKNVQQKMREFKLNHPVMLDNDFGYWKALNNHYWPSFYLVDRSGTIRYRFVGETQKGSAQARKIEQAVLELLGGK